VNVFLHLLYLSINFIRTCERFVFDQAIGGGLVKRDDIWNLVFTDNNHHDFRYMKGDLKLNVSFTVFTMRSDICCRLMASEAPCNCPTNFKVGLEKGISLSLFFFRTTKLHRKDKLTRQTIEKVFLIALFLSTILSRMRKRIFPFLSEKRYNKDNVII